MDSQRYEYVRSLATKAVYEHRPFDVIVREKFIRGGSKRSTQLVFGAWSAIDMALGAFGYSVDDKDEIRSEEHTSELQSRGHLVCRLLLEKKKPTEVVSER